MRTRTKTVRVALPAVPMGPSGLCLPSVDTLAYSASSAINRFAG